MCIYWWCSTCFKKKRKTKLNQADLNWIDCHFSRHQGEAPDGYISVSHRPIPISPTPKQNSKIFPFPPKKRAAIPLPPICAIPTEAGRYDRNLGSRLITCSSTYCTCNDIHIWDENDVNEIISNNFKHVMYECILEHHSLGVNMNIIYTYVHTYTYIHI